MEAGFQIVDGVVHPDKASGGGSHPCLPSSKAPPLLAGPNAKQYDIFQYYALSFSGKCASRLVRCCVNRGISHSTLCQDYTRVGDDKADGEARARL